MRISSIKNIFPTKLISKIKSAFTSQKVVRIDQPPVDCFESSKLVLDSIKSKTVEKLFSAEFKPKERINSINARITTVIDRKTQKPVETFVAGIMDNNQPLREEWIMLVKDAKGEIKLADGENYRTIGNVIFHKNDKMKMLMPTFQKQKQNGEQLERVNSYMRAIDNDKYQGIGVRLHQLRMERMLMLGYKNALIVADGNSYLFHKNLGFNSYAQPLRGSQKQGFLSTLTKINKQPYTYNSKFITYDANNKIDVGATLDKMLTDHYSNSDKVIDISPNMTLSEQAISDWKQLIKRQPILMDNVSRL